MYVRRPLSAVSTDEKRTRNSTHLGANSEQYSPRSERLMHVRRPLSAVSTGEERTRNSTHLGANDGCTCVDPSLPWCPLGRSELGTVLTSERTTDVRAPTPLCRAHWGGANSEQYSPRSKRRMHVRRPLSAVVSTGEERTRNSTHLGAND